MLKTLGLPSNTINILIDLCQRAGLLIIDIYHSSNFNYDIKPDLSPVTEADEKAEVLITETLVALNPHIKCIGEEATAKGHIPDITDAPFWLIDPLDGTKGFIRGSFDFTVNIALIVDGVPVLGIIHCPAFNTTYVADENKSAFKITPHSTRQPLKVKPAHKFWRFVGSQNHQSANLQEYLNQMPVKSFIRRGSSLKFGLVAEDVADFYLRTTPTMEWDTAAGHALLSAAGGHVIQHDGTPLLYGKPDFLNPSFSAVGGIPLHKVPLFSKKQPDIYS